MSYCLNPVCPSPENPASHRFCQSCGRPLLLGQRYRALSVLGQGGFGKTFLAVDESLPEQPRCVIKQLLPMQGDRHSPNEVERFRQEVQRLWELGDHPQIPALIDHLEEPDGNYLIQQFIEGRDFEVALEEGGPFAEGGIRQLLADLLPVLEFIHQHRVIHRDIKPKNLIAPLSQAPVVLVDFGASKYVTGTALARTGTVIGSAGYLAPEQAMGKAIFSSDLYSLGVTCAHLLTGMHPFELYSVSQDDWVWQQYLLKPISAELAYVLNKMLRRSVSLRYRTATAALKDLRSPPLEATQAAPRPTYSLPKSISVQAGYVLEASAAAPPSPPPPASNQPWFCAHRLIGHEGAVTAVAISPSGQVLASGSTDCRILLWNLLSGTRLHTFEGRSLWNSSGHSDRINGLHFTPEGAVLISASDDGTIKLWDLGDRKMVSTLSSSEWVISAIAVSPTGQVLISGGANGAIELWDLERGALIERLWRHQDRISGLAVSPNGQTLLSSSYDGTVRLWDLRTAELVNTFRGHRDRIGAIAVSPDWRVLVSGSWDGELTFWDLKYTEPICTLLAHTDAIHCLAASPVDGPTGPVFASGGEDARINLWQLGAGDRPERQAAELRGAAPTARQEERSPAPVSRMCVLTHDWPVNSLMFSPDGKALVSASADESIKIWYRN